MTNKHSKKLRVKNPKSSKIKIYQKMILKKIISFKIINLQHKFKRNRPLNYSLSYRGK